MRITWIASQMKPMKRRTSKNAGRGRNTKSIFSAPAALSQPLRPYLIPGMRSNGRYTRVSHTENFTPVAVTGTPYAVTSFNVNPGVPSCFPWLCDVAGRYESYKFRSIHFDFITQSPTNLGGSVCLAFDFDAMDAAPATMFEARSYRDRAGDVIWRPIRLTLDLIQGDKAFDKKIRLALPASPYDLKTYDLGRLHVCTEGAAAGTLGYLEVTYVVDLFTPQIQNTIGGALTCTAGLDATHLFGTTYTVDPEACMPFEVVSDQVIRFTQYFEGAVYVATVGTVLTANWAPVISADGQSAAFGNNVVNAAGTSTVMAYRIRAVPGTTMTPTQTATTITSVGYKFFRCSYNNIGT